MKELMYGFEHDEILTCTTMDEFVEEVIDRNREKIGESESTTLDRIEFPVKCVVYRREKLPEVANLARDILENTIERLDENYRIGADDGTDITEPMRKAAMDFALAMRKEYLPWNCEPVDTVLLHRKDLEETK